MELKQNDREYIEDMVQRGEMTVDQANVKMVLMQRVRIVRGRIPANVRKALNDAVKRGELRHIKKEGKKPEAYYHPTFDYLMRAERNQYERDTIAAIAKILI